MTEESKIDIKTKETRNPKGSRIIKAITDVYVQLGVGLLESIYQKAIAKELQVLGYHVELEYPIVLSYIDSNNEKHYISTLRIDLLVDDDIVIELKTIKHKPVHETQLKRYLTSLNKPTGYLINLTENINIVEIHREETTTTTNEKVDN